MSFYLLIRHSCVNCPHLIIRCTFILIYRMIDWYCPANCHVVILAAITQPLSYWLMKKYVNHTINIYIYIYDHLISWGLVSQYGIMDQGRHLDRGILNYHLLIGTCMSWNFVQTNIALYPSQMSPNHNRHPWDQRLVYICNYFRKMFLIIFYHILFWLYHNTFYVQQLLVLIIPGIIVFITVIKSSGV